MSWNSCSISPRDAAFAVATRERRLWGEARSLSLQGLPVDDAVLLLEREIERPLDVMERSEAASLCASVGGHPLRLLQCAAIVRERGISLDAWASNIGPESLVTESLASIDEKQRRALLALAALPGVPLQVQHLSGIAELHDIEPSLMALVRRGLVLSTQSRHQLADGVGDQLRRTEDVKPWVNRAITYFTAWAERYRRNPDNLLEESEALLRVQQYATDARRWGEVLRIGQLLEGALIAGARWGAWGIVLEHCLAAAKAIGDQSAEAWAFHEMGTRAVCLGEPGVARSALSQALKLRETLNEDAGAAASRRNLSFVLAPVVDHSPSATALRDDPLDLDALPLRDGIQPAVLIPKTKSALPVMVFLLALLSGLAYWGAPGASSWRSWHLADIGSAPLEPASEEQRAAARTTLSAASVAGARQRPRRCCLRCRGLGTDRANILIFTPRPGSIATGGSTKLCYAVSGAVQVQVEPGIGDVNATSRLTCLRVAPVRTTTYELTAHGRDGQPVRQQLVIVVP